MRMDVSLEGKATDTAVTKKPKAKAVTKTKAPIANVVEFLNDHQTAKIIVIIEAHCLENGSFVWTGDTPVTYQGCQLLEVSHTGSTVLRHTTLNICVDTPGLYSA